MNHLAAKAFFATLVALVIGVSATLAQSTAFTYQGKLTDGGNPASGPYDFTFRLFDAVSGGSQVGVDVTVDDVQVTAGVFTVNLNFGSSPFTANTGNFLEISVRPGTSTGTLTLLDPRQPITSSPYSVQTLRAASAAVADNANALGGVPASQYVQTDDTRLSDARIPLSGSANYVQNSSAQQTLSNFNISGTGTANVFDATQFNIGGNRVLSVPGNFNLFAGVGAGTNTTGQENAFFGSNAGLQNTGGFGNTFVGAASGRNNTGGVANTFAGRSSGLLNQLGSQNAFFGENAGRINSSGNANSFFGNNAGNTNTTGGNNTIIGFDADVASNNLNFATAIGSGAVASSNNTVVLGRNLDTVRVPGSMNVDGPMTGTITNALEAFNASNLGGVSASLFVQTSDTRLTDARSPTAGSPNYIQNGTGVQALSNFNISGTGTANILNAGTQFNINGSRVLSVAGTANFFAGFGAGQINTGTSNSFVGDSAGSSNTNGRANSIFGARAGRDNSTGDLNSFFGAQAGLSNETGDANAFFGGNAGVSTTTGSTNSFFGYGAGEDNIGGMSNSFIGYSAGKANTTGSDNTLLGFRSNVSVGDLTNATALGAKAMVAQSNSLVLGSINGVNTATADTNVGIGTTTPASRLHVNGMVRVTAGGIFIANPNTVIITSPNGACWGITVNNSGVIGAFSTSCP